MPTPMPAISLTAPLHDPGADAHLRDLRALHDALRRDLDRARRDGLPDQRDLRARLAVCAADLMDAHVDNLPV